MRPLNIASISSVRTPTKRQEITCKGTYLSNRTYCDWHFLSSHRYCLTYYTFFLSEKSWEIEEDNVFCIKKPFRWVPWVFTKERKKFLLLSCFGRADWRPRAQQQNCCTCSCETVTSSWWWLAQQQPIYPTYFTLIKKRASCKKPHHSLQPSLCSSNLGGASFCKGISRAETVWCMFVLLSLS